MAFDRFGSIAALFANQQSAINRPLIRANEEDATRNGEEVQNRWGHKLVPLLSPSLPNPTGYRVTMSCGRNDESALRYTRYPSKLIEKQCNMWILCERGYRLRNFRGFLVCRGQRVACRLDTTMLLTVHSVCSDADPIIRLRKRPSATSTDAVESGRPSDTIGSGSRMCCQCLALSMTPKPTDSDSEELFPSWDVRLLLEHLKAAFSDLFEHLGQVDEYWRWTKSGGYLGKETVDPIFHGLMKYEKAVMCHHPRSRHL